MQLVRVAAWFLREILDKMEIEVARGCLVTRVPRRRLGWNLTLGINVLAER